MSVRLKKLLVILVPLAATGLFLNPGRAAASSATHVLPVSAVIPAGSGTCTFDTGGPYAIVFPAALNPLAPTQQTASVTFNVTCTGLNGAGGKTVIIERVGSAQLYLKQGSDQIPYSLTLPHSQGAVNKKSAPVTLTATIAALAYQNVPAGAYSDSIVINILP